MGIAGYDDRKKGGVPVSKHGMKLNDQVLLLLGERTSL